MLRVLIFFLILFTGFLEGNPVFCASIKGYAKVIDGDSLIVNGKSIRLRGIDAPEGDQWCRDAKGIYYRCGVMATAWMINAISSRRVSCDWIEKDRYKRLLGTCFVGGSNLNANIVQAGWSVAYRKFTKEYASQQDAARLAKRGLWAGNFEMPWEWRARTQTKSAEPRLPKISKPLQKLKQGCYKICERGKACGNSCVRKSVQCKKTAGRACDN